MSTMTADQTETLTIGRTDYRTVRTVTVTVTTDGNTMWALTDGRLVEPCGKCVGMGGTPGSIPAFAHVEAAVCFECTGRGFTKVYADAAAYDKIVARRAKDAARREAKRAAAAAEFVARNEAKMAAWVAENPETAAALRPYMRTTGHGYDSLPMDLDDCETTTQYRLTQLAHHVFGSGIVPDARETADAVRYLGWVARDVAKAEASTHIGTIGEKTTVTGTVTFEKIIDGSDPFGRPTSKMMVKIDVEGSEVVVFTAAQWAYEVNVGDTLTVTGPVSKHGAYNGIPQTTISGRGTKGAKVVVA